MGRGRGRGGGGRGRGGKRQFGGDGGGPQEKRARSDPWRFPEDIESNGLFEEYYKGQGVCPPEEWDEFLLALKKPLPITFRINGQGKFADRLVAKMEGDFMTQLAAGPIVIEGEPVEKPHPLAWYPGKLAWQMNFSRSQLRKLPVLGDLHEFIKRENEVGSITRQEAVSMVPPLFLDVKPHHRVLDMCAAPGSKTFQLLEMLHAGPEPATGLVVANDADAMRCNLLTHQTKRMCSPALMVTNHEAQQFPCLRNLLPDEADSHVLFDRILCDVPCSGDGTMRKAPDIWRRWGTGQGNGLHAIQLKITLRAVELLKVGGRIVYSTCTFNPVEDEAVVAEVLRRTKGALELLDVSDHLPELRRLPGMQRWRVKDAQRWYDSWEEGKQGYKLDPSMFPNEQSHAMPLDRCMRFLPHHQDTGGFFVCVLQKVKELDGPLEAPTLDHRSTRKQERKAAQKQQKQQVQQQQKEKAEAAPEAEAVAAAEGKEQQEEGPAAAADGEAPAAAAASGEAGVAGEAGAAAAEAVAAAAGGDGDGDEEKRQDWTWKQKREDKYYAQGLPEWGIRGGGSRGREGGGGRHRGIDPIVPYVDQQQLAAIRDFYGMAPDCPVQEALIARSAEPRPKKLHYVSLAVKNLLRTDVREQLKVIGAGVKVLERQDSKDGLVPCSYRFAQDGLPALLPHVTRQRFHPTLDELLTILQDRLVGLPEECKKHITKGKQGEAGAGEAAGAGGSGEEVKAEQEVKEGEGAADDGAAAAAAAADAEVKPEQEEGAAQVKAEGADQAAAAAAAAPDQQQQQGQDQQQQQQKQPRTNLTDPRTLEELQSVSMGCCVAVMRAEDAAELGFGSDADAASNGGGLAAAAPLAIACWRGRGNLNVLVSKQEAAQLAERILEARIKLAQHAEQQAAAAAEAAPAEAEAELMVA